MASNDNIDELTRKCQEIFENLILESKNEIDILNKDKILNKRNISTKKPYQPTETRSKSICYIPPNSYGMYGPTRYQCDIECPPSRPRSNSVPNFSHNIITSDDEFDEPENQSPNPSILMTPTVEPIQEEGEFKIVQRAKSVGHNFRYSKSKKYNTKYEDENLLIASLKQALEKESENANKTCNSHSRSRSLSSISESEILKIENSGCEEANNDEDGVRAKKQPKMNRNRSNSYCFGCYQLQSNEVQSINEYKQRVEYEVYCQQYRRHEKLALENKERNKYQEFLKWQEKDYQKKRNSWSSS